MTQREASIERAIVDAAKRAGWTVRKFEARKGDPDRILFRAGRVAFLEIKRPGGRLTNLQRAARQQWIMDGFPVGVVTSRDEAVAFLEDVGC